MDGMPTVRFLPWILVGQLLLLVACGSVGEQELPGTYVARYAGGSDQLTIFPNGQYEHVLNFGDVVATNAGKWAAEKPPGLDMGVSFYDFQFRIDGESVKPAGIWFVLPRRSMLNGSVKLCFDPDAGECFVKDRS